MRKAMIIACLALAGCGAEYAKPSEMGTAIWKDPETGCNYIIYRDGFAQAAVGSLSIRFRGDGKADCPDADTAGERE